MKLKITAFILAALLLVFLPHQFHLVRFAVPRIAWIETGFIIAFCVTVSLAMVLAWPFKKVAKAGVISLSVVLFATLLLFSEVSLKYTVPWALVIGSVLAAIGIFLPPKMSKASSVLLGLCVFSWLYLTLVYSPIAVFYVDYFYRLEGDLAGSLASMASVIGEEALTAALMLPSLLLYLIARGRCRCASKLSSSPRSGVYRAMMCRATKRIRSSSSRS